MTFLRYFPNVETLAKASEEQVLKVWQGLGYYSRALNMHAAAQQIVNEFGGQFPNNYDSIRKLKGVGDYTAAAISSIAFDLHYPAVDGNVKRVASRFFGIRNPIQSQSAVDEIRKALEVRIVHFQPGEFNQAMMELGALICLPRNPLCTSCPMATQCYAFANQQQQILPVQIPKKKATEIYLDFLFLETNGSTWVQKRGKLGIWKGLFEFPNFAGEKEVAELPDSIVQCLEKPAKSKLVERRDYVHKLTHRTIFARFWHLSGLPSNIVKGNKEFTEIKITDLERFPIHRLMHRYLSETGLIEAKDNND